MRRPREPRLIPCPFCGSSMVEVMQGEGERWRVQCHACDAIGPSSLFDKSRRWAVAEWNKRVTVLLDRRDDIAPVTEEGAPHLWGKN